LHWVTCKSLDRENEECDSEEDRDEI
jgi:hypothetical protein